MATNDADRAPSQGAPHATEPTDEVQVGEGQLGAAPPPSDGAEPKPEPVVMSEPELAAVPESDPTPGDGQALGTEPTAGPAPEPAATSELVPEPDLAPEPPTRTVAARDLLARPRVRAYGALALIALLVGALLLSPVPAWLGGLAHSDAFQTVADPAPQTSAPAPQGSAAPATDAHAPAPSAPTAATTVPASSVAPTSPAVPATSADGAASPAAPEAVAPADPAPAPAAEPEAQPEPPAPEPAPAPEADPAPAPEAQVVRVTVVVDGSAAGGPSYRVPVQLDPGATAYDALVASGANVNARATVYGTYVAAIDGLAEFAHGPMSGWVYAIDGVEPNVAASGRVMRDGQTLVWTYVNVEA